jgi:two-component system OmpR family sensor kinase
VTELEGQLPAELEPERASAEHRLAMIGSMLADLVDPGRPLEREAVPVEELVQLAVPLFAALRPQGPPLALDVPAHLPPLWIDRVAVLRVLANLLTNAAVHNADRAELSVRLCVRADDDATVIEVADTGRGIAPEDQARIFEFGVRVDPDGRTRGHGLGLSSSRRLVEAHGGTLSVESQPGHGAAFRMRLPLAPSPDRPGRPA